MKSISKIMVTALLAMFLVAWASPSEAWLDNLQQGRCERTNRLVKLGDHYTQVTNECGEPDAVTAVGSTTTSHIGGKSTYIRNGRVVKFYGKNNTVHIEMWTYLNGWKKRPLVIRFSGGVLEGISLGNI